MDRLDRTLCPTLDDVGAYIQNPLFHTLCSTIKEEYRCTEKIEFSACSMERGWNVKFKKSGRALCTIYPRESYFTVMVVVGTKEKPVVEAMLPTCSAALQELYARTREGNGQRWLMIDLEDQDDLYRDVLRLIEIRTGKSRPAP